MAPNIQIATKLANWGKAPLKWSTPKFIEPKKLGWIRPDGKINFQTEDVAMEYAKNRAVGALKQSKPIERCVLIKKNTIIGEIDGDAVRCDFSKFKDESINATLVHGHPTAKGQGALPISLQDYFAMIGSKLNKVIAYNKQGEFSELTTIPNNSRLFKLLPQKMQNVINLLLLFGRGSMATEKYSKDFAKLFPKELQARVEQGIHKNAYPYGNAKLTKAFERNPYTKEEFTQISEVEKGLYLDGSLHKMIHEFWENFAKKLDCTYKTNFSNLVSK